MSHRRASRLAAAVHGRQSGHFLETASLTIWFPGHSPRNSEYDALRLEGEFYAKKLIDAGVNVRVLRYCGVCHGFFDALGVLPQSEAANEIANLLTQI